MAELVMERSRSSSSLQNKDRKLTSVARDGWYHHLV